MFPILAGFLAGAGALYMFSELSAKQDEKANGGTFVAKELDIKGVKNKLDRYFWQASKLYQKCNDLSIKSCDMMMGSIELPDAAPLTKMGNKVHDAMLPVSRRWILGQLQDINNNCHKLLRTNLDVFKRANEILGNNGKEVILIQKSHVPSSELVLDNAVHNENWSSDFDGLLDRVRDFIEASYDAANQMIEALDTVDSSSSATGDDELKSICA